MQREKGTHNVRMKTGVAGMQPQDLETTGGHRLPPPEVKRQRLPRIHERERDHVDISSKHLGTRL